MKEKRFFLEESAQALSGIYDFIAAVPALQLMEIDPERAALIVVDMVNGFVKKGAMSSPRVCSINEKVAALCVSSQSRGIEVLAFADCHTMQSPEFVSYPPHCLCGDWESEVTEEIRASASLTLFQKNSTNGFLEPAFQQWLENHSEKDIFLIVGDCTDICVQQLALSLKADFNRKNQLVRVIVPQDCNETFDLGLHSGDLMHAVALFSMSAGGVEIVSEIKE